MAWWVKTLAYKPKDCSSSPESHRQVVACTCNHNIPRVSQEAETGESVRSSSIVRWQRHGLKNKRVPTPKNVLWPPNVCNCTYVCTLSVSLPSPSHTALKTMTYFPRHEDKTKQTGAKLHLRWASPNSSHCSGSNAPAWNCFSVTSDFSRGTSECLWVQLLWVFSEAAVDGYSHVCCSGFKS